jgi:serine/threonine protein kinase
MHDRPNGRHQCIIGEALGPSLASCRLCSFVWDKEVIPADIVCQLVGQITLGVEYLHKRNVVHGDLHQGNTLLYPPTPMATLAAVESHMGKLRKWLVTDMDSDQIPRYLVSHPTDPEFLRLCFTPLQAKLCDFSEAWIPGGWPLAPPRYCHPEYVPSLYRPPKALLGIVCRVSADGFMGSGSAHTPTLHRWMWSILWRMATGTDCCPKWSWLLADFRSHCGQAGRTGTSISMNKASH